MAEDRDENRHQNRGLHDAKCRGERTEESVN